MYEVRVDDDNAIVGFVLDGVVRVEEIKRFVIELQAATMKLAGRDIKVKADVRGLKPASQEVTEMIRSVQEFGLKAGVKRVAEIVDSELTALQLNRVARESGTDKVLRRFWDDESAVHWLIHGDS